MIEITTDNTISIERVFEFLAYNSETGAFTWKKNGCRRIRPGDLAGSINSSGHRQIKIDGVAYTAHRLAWFIEYREWPCGEIDHINRTPDDNRICNLRIATRRQNCANKRPRSDSKSGVTGVHRAESGRWIAQATVGGKYKCLGRFDTKEQAREAHAAAAIKEYGEFARV